MMWPDDGLRLWEELRAAPERVAIVVGDAEPALSLGSLLGLDATKVGGVLAEHSSVPSAPDVMAALEGAKLLIDMDVVFDPELALDPLRLLRNVGRAVGGCIAVWPGVVRGREAAYSAPGRSDYYASFLSDTLLIRRRAVRFPDETPYSVERIP